MQSPHLQQPVTGRFVWEAAITTATMLAFGLLTDAATTSPAAAQDQPVARITVSPETTAIERINQKLQADRRRATSPGTLALSLVPGLNHRSPRTPWPPVWPRCCSRPLKRP